MKRKSLTKNLIVFFPLIIGLMLILPATLPLFKSTFFHMHDNTHVARLVELTGAINDGHFPVRWSKNLGFGYGMPLFNFYAPLPYYFSDLIHRLGFDFINSIKAVFFLNFLASFLSMYYFAKYFWGKLGGYISATAFIYVPYRALDFYVRGALGELQGITFIAISLFTLLMLFRKKSLKWIVFTALSFAGIILSHNLVALIALPALVLLAVAFILGTKPPLKLEKIKRFALALILGIALSAFYSVPALLEKSFTAVDKLTQEFFHYSHHFIYLRQLWNSPWGFGGSIFGLEDGISFEIGKIQLLLAILGGLSLFHALKMKKRFTAITILTSGLIIIVSMLMASFRSRPLWDILSFLSYIQFPWRFLSLIIIFISFLAGGISIYIQKFPAMIRNTVSIFLIFLIIVLNLDLFRPEKYLDDDNGLYYTSPTRIQTEMSTVLPDFISPQVNEFPDPPKERFILSDIDTTELETIIDRTQEFSLRVKIQNPTILTANIFHFPGWKLYIDGKEAEYSVGDDLPVLNLSLEPKSSETTYIISGKLTDTPIRLIANLISAASLMVIIYLALYERFNQKRSKTTT